ncbi:hypothetical protein PENTCL1PPCAC_20648, partial [Pristionchus entomophagus]
YFPSPLPGHDFATIIHHSTVDGLAVILNILLIFAVIMRSPATLRSYKVILINSAIIDLISSATMLLTMVRVVGARHVLAYIFDGPCVFFSGFICHCIFTIMAASLSQSLFLIAASFGYRLYIIGRPSPSNNAVMNACLLLSIPNMIILTTYIFALDDPEDVRAEIRMVRPEYELDDYVLEGHASIFKVFTLFTILAITQPIGPTLVLIFIMRKKLLTKLTAHSEQMSGRTTQMHKTLTQVLTLQSLLPVFFSGATVSYALCLFDIMYSPVQEHFTAECVSFMALLSPAITLYCMKPYMNFVVSLVRCDITEIRRSAMYANFSEESTYKIHFSEPSTTRTTEIILINSTIIDLVSSSTMLLTMVRIMAAGHVIAYI